MISLRWKNNFLLAVAIAILLQSVKSLETNNSSIETDLKLTSTSSSNLRPNVLPTTTERKINPQIATVNSSNVLVAPPTFATTRMMTTTIEDFEAEFTTSTSTSTLSPSSSKSPTVTSTRNAETTLKAIIDGCQHLKCEHSTVCQFDGYFHFCECGWAYSGLRCESALPLYLSIALAACCLLTIIISISSLICACQRKNKKVSPNVAKKQSRCSKLDLQQRKQNKGALNGNISQETFFTVDESAYADPSDFYGGDCSKGAADVKSSIPTIPRISLSNNNNNIYSSSGELYDSSANTGTYRTFQPKRVQSAPPVHN